jgi:hypothetical protein
LFVLGVKPGFCSELWARTKEHKDSQKITATIDFIIGLAFLCDPLVTSRRSGNGDYFSRYIVVQFIVKAPQALNWVSSGFGKCSRGLVREFTVKPLEKPDA